VQAPLSTKPEILSRIGTGRGYLTKDVLWTLTRGGAGVFSAAAEVLDRRGG
jgi:hypothetical protein